MRGGGRAGGRSFRPPRVDAPERGGQFDLEIIKFGDLPVAPVLSPINDDWSISNFDDPVDASDCAAYPASPYCDGDFISLRPIWYEWEIRSNECQTCVYIYPVILFVKLQPLIICKRDPNCKEDQPPPPDTDIIRRFKPRRYDDDPTPNRYKSAECASREGVINRWHNRWNDGTENSIEGFVKQKEAGVYRLEFKIEPGELIERVGATEPIVGYGNLAPECHTDLSFPFSDTDRAPWVYHTFADYYAYQRINVKTIRQLTPQSPIEENITQFTFISWNVGACCGMLPEPPPPPRRPPPPSREEEEEERRRQPPPPNRKRRRKPPMCCNSCNDSSELSRLILKEVRKAVKILGDGTIKVPKALDSTLKNDVGTTTSITQAIDYFGQLFAARIGTGRYPIEVPQSLLTGVGDKTQDVHSQTDYLYWLTHQLDALVGEFPIKIKIKDIDPLTAGDQEKTVQIPNLAEALAEIYGLSLKSSINQEVEMNMLIRLAAEVVATKNGVAVTQDYARANASFLGYRGNPTARELSYNFDFANADLSGEKTFVLEDLLKTVTGNVQGWKNDDNETLVDYLKRLMFAAGIIKAAFFRNKKQINETAEGIKDMTTSERANKEEWDKFLLAIRDPNSQYNKDYPEKPDIKNWFIDPTEL